MKKILLAAVLGTGLLASCDSNVTINGGADGYYGDGNGQSSSLTLGTLTNYQTNWQLASDVSDVNSNRVLRAGTYVICDNTNTQISFDLNWSGYLKDVGLQFAGYNTDTYRNIGVYRVNSSYGSQNVSFNMGSHMAPLNISGQSIVITPVTSVAVKGYTYARAQGIDGNGNVSNVATTSYTIPVVDCR